MHTFSSACVPIETLHVLVSGSEGHPEPPPQVHELQPGREHKVLTSGADDELVGLGGSGEAVAVGLALGEPDLEGEGSSQVTFERRGESRSRYARAR